jgi:hypothetical protein
MGDQVGVATAEPAAREQWLHWVEHGTTIRPEADGEWGPRAGPPDTIDPPVKPIPPRSSRRPRRLRSVP